MKNRVVLVGKLEGEIKDLLVSFPPYRANQIYMGILSGALNTEEIKNLPLDLRKELSEKYCIDNSRVISELYGSEGTIKLGVELSDGSIIECVLLKDGKGRKTACLSTQAGCPVSCIFCKTGTLGFKRNLTSAEIAGQFMHLKRKETENKTISHIVIMGMGEPLLNLNELRQALHFFTDPGGLNISKRRITLSTSGIIDGINSLTDEGPEIGFALSLVSARQELRESLMPISWKNPLPFLKEALINYQKKYKNRITLEIVLMKGINTGKEDAEAVYSFSEGLNTVINIIPWNPVEGLKFGSKIIETPQKKEIADFTAILENCGLNITKRYEKGNSIQGACGQLGSLQSNLLP